MSSYLSAMLINNLQMQVGVRSYTKCSYILLDFSVLANKVSFELPSKKYVASLKQIFIFFKAV